MSGGNNNVNYKGLIFYWELVTVLTSITYPSHIYHISFSHQSHILLTSITYPSHIYHISFSHLSHILLTSITYPSHIYHISFSHLSHILLRWLLLINVMFENCWKLFWLDFWHPPCIDPHVYIRGGGGLAIWCWFMYSPTFVLGLWYVNIRELLIFRGLGVFCSEYSMINVLKYGTNIFILIFSLYKDFDQFSMTKKKTHVV